ncbi:hypothetical protein LOK49_LG03G03339 [Camellia lanceoleosa]|uniref:Uncharacterized protein n=1 Tax=Camellia lanceoleosa TaxID=1840588 RepID=A0ACC0I5U3_9ERIC|nr:hypothetical protein LOK49_LG03G03339 [Camellia lanceoleosa]
MAGTRTLILMTKEALSEHEQAMEGLPGSEIDGQSQAVSLSKNAVAFAVLLRNQGELLFGKKGELSFCQTGCPEGADAAIPISSVYNSAQSAPNPAIFYLVLVNLETFLRFVRAV